jgi:hypothetical protein
MKNIKLILGCTVFFTMITAIMLAPAIIFVICFEPSTLAFFIGLLPLSAFGFMIGFVLLEKVTNTGVFDKLLD